MNLWLRLVRVWLAARWRGPVDLSEVSVIRMRVWPHDLDLWGHVNGGRYLTMSDLARLDLFVRGGLMRLARKNHWVVPLGSVSVRYHRPVRLFQACEMHTRILGWDDKWGYVETRFVRDGRPIATVVVKGLVRGPEGNISPGRVLELLGIPGSPPVVPDHIRVWIDADTRID